MVQQGLKNNRWFIIAHCFNMDGRAASQTITDRLPYFMDKGIDLVVLSAPTGIKDPRFPHYQIISLAPSGIRFEMRFVIKNKIRHTILQHTLKAISAILCFPFYFVEKVFLQFDSQWSWFIGASIKGAWIINRHHPTLLYSTAGPPSTHITAYILHKIYGLPWMAELHDPLILDDQHPKWHKYYFSRLVERIVCNNASLVVYFTNRALENAQRRHPLRNRGMVVRPGAHPPDFRSVKYRKRNKIHFGHFGSLDKTRNLVPFIRALHELMQQYPEWRSFVAVDIFGCELDAESRRALREYPLEGIMREHGRLEYDPDTGKSGRQRVLEIMKATDVLLLLHGGEGSVCYEYIPSKLYEYLLTGRPLLGMVECGTELEEFLRENHHTAVDKDNVQAIKVVVKGFIDTWRSLGLADGPSDSPFTVGATVDKLIAAVSTLTAADRSRVK
jgi:glycosyltransferase involved in cell wall biosynthesis